MGIIKHFRGLGDDYEDEDDRDLPTDNLKTLSLFMGNWIKENPDKKVVDYSFKMNLYGNWFVERKL